jgi:hypothetical protein
VGKLADNSIFKFAADIRIDPSDLIIDDGTRFFGEPAGTPTIRRVPKLSYISRHARNPRPPNRCRALTVSEYWGIFVQVNHQTDQYALRSEVRLKPILQAQPKTPRANLGFRSQSATGQDYIYLRPPRGPNPSGPLPCDAPFERSHLCRQFHASYPNERARTTMGRRSDRFNR